MGLVFKFRLDVIVAIRAVVQLGLIHAASLEGVLNRNSLII